MGLKGILTENFNVFFFIFSLAEVRPEFETGLDRGISILKLPAHSSVFGARKPQKRMLYLIQEDTPRTGDLPIPFLTLAKSGMQPR